ncbi:hypothetical protein [Oceanobacter mangrovi]|uniref:hypothetical protein n=1 Tax=Oceanobacter mangrovi TaxID=2862510 RepID=UPI001FEA1CE9|nr:hypothetical protein [Oceanobacter mangrovi]
MADTADQIAVGVLVTADRSATVFNGFELIVVVIAVGGGTFGSNDGLQALTVIPGECGGAAIGIDNGGDQIVIVVAPLCGQPGNIGKGGGAVKFIIEIAFVAALEQAVVVEIADVFQVTVAVEAPDDGAAVVRL